MFEPLDVPEGAMKELLVARATGSQGSQPE